MRLFWLPTIVSILSAIPQVDGKRKSAGKKTARKAAISAAAQALNTEQLDLVSSIMTEHASLVKIFSDFCSFATQPPKEQAVTDYAIKHFFKTKFCKLEEFTGVHQKELLSINEARLAVLTNEDGLCEFDLASDLLEVSSRIVLWISDVRELVKSVAGAYAPMRDMKAKLGRFHVMQNKITSFMQEMNHHISIWNPMTKRAESSHQAIVEHLKQTTKPQEIIEEEISNKNVSSESLFFKQIELTDRIKSGLGTLVQTLSNFCASLETPTVVPLSQYEPFVLITNGLCQLDKWMAQKFSSLSGILEESKIQLGSNTPLIDQVYGLSNELVQWASLFSKLYEKSLPIFERFYGADTSVFGSKVSQVLKVLPPLVKRCEHFKESLEKLHNEIVSFKSEQDAEQAFLSQTKEAVETQVSKSSRKKKKKARAHQTKVDAENDESEQPDGVLIEGAQAQDSPMKADELITETTQVVESSQVETKNPADEMVETVQPVNSEESQVHASSATQVVESYQVETKNPADEMVETVQPVNSEESRARASSARKKKKNKGKLTQVVVVEAKGDALPDTTAENKKNSEIAQLENQTEVDQSQSPEREQQNGDSIELAKDESKAEETMAVLQSDAPNSTESMESYAVRESSNPRGAWANIVLPANWGVPGSWNREESCDEYSEDDAESSWQFRSGRWGWDEGSAAVENDLKKKSSDEEWEDYRSWVEKSQRQDAEEWKVVDYHPLAKMAKKWNLKSQTYPNKK